MTDPNAAEPEATAQDAADKAKGAAQEAAAKAGEFLGGVRDRAQAALAGQETTFKPVDLALAAGLGLIIGLLLKKR